MTRQTIHSPDAPAAIGPYSQAIRVGNIVYLSGQIGLDPQTGQLVDGLEAQTHRVLQNLRAVAAASGGTLDDIVKVSLLMVDLGGFAKVNEIMVSYFKTPYPARMTYQVAALPRGALVEVEGTLVLPGAASADPQTGWRETFDQTKGQ
jgi:reactive intermediate/imine deaminase